MITMPNSQALNAETLIAEHNKVDDFIKAENKRFAEYVKPYKERLQAIEDQLLAMLNQLGPTVDNISGDAGTAYKSTLMNVKIENRDALIDFALDNWDEYGNELLMISVQKDATKQYMQANDGKPPPGVGISWFTRVNVRRS